MAGAVEAFQLAARAVFARAPFRAGPLGRFELLLAVRVSGLLFPRSRAAAPVRRLLDPGCCCRPDGCGGYRPVLPDQGILPPPFAPAPQDCSIKAVSA